MKKILLILVVIGILCPVVTAERPTYSFDNEVFSELPYYPEDLEEIKSLFRDNKISIEQLSENYYLQPEFYPTWASSCEELYKEDRVHYGIYGFNIFPSLFYINIEEKGEIHEVIAFLSNGFGIQVKTGMSIDIEYDPEIVKVVKVLPEEEDILLQETHPKFQKDWVQPLVLVIEILKKQDTEIKVFNSKPSQYLDTLWGEMYGTGYATPEKFSSNVPRLTIKITGEEDLEKQEQKSKDNYSLLLLFLGFCVLLVTIVSVLKWKAKRKSS